LSTRHLLRQPAIEYPDSRHVTDVGLDTATDAEIWAWAGEHDYMIVSKDSDFRQLAFLHGPPPKAVWLRMGIDDVTRFPPPTTKRCSYSRRRNRPRSEPVVLGRSLLERSGQVDDHGDRLSNLCERERSDIAERSDHPCRRDGPKVLALRSGGLLESIHGIRLDDDLGVGSGWSIAHRTDRTIIS
jgi:hypothetical protein